MQPPTRMRQVYDGGPPGKFGVPMKPLTALCVAVIASLVAYRFYIYPVDGGGPSLSRLDVAADYLGVYYGRNPPRAGVVEGVTADGSRIDVRLRVVGERRKDFSVLPPNLRSASLASVCPASHAQVWDLIGVQQEIRIRAIASDGTDLLAVTCVRHRL